MRVKLFEHLSESFIEIDEKKYNDLVGNSSNRCSFEKGEISKIEQLGFKLVGKISESRIIFTKNVNKFILVSKIEDEYYIVLVFGKLTPIKCDQIDGILNYMKTL